ncbi:hypothetical protein [Ectropis obliqua nucleopolyhedrovirus]|uniref:Uncharacterized protein n=1 Tax=Ectropis obliqua nucleopolyhedrovirus TaxID=59376 RepID=Q77SB0_9ABAC|nr:hypothetical protein EONV_gp123 [Ectropis obliqua nucleopolyhedrovirus]AAQ88178.1 hypothetical protein [Ectropis obliqua nucleopolyhedrovirus]AGS47864.1 hypothetical protein wdlz-06GM8 [Ectropis obliqua nucleopolyhedrovirus]QWV59711.1 hypothetical protein EONV_gp123 [Ectropis obliqua nucleopolyhedrovirus]UYO72919.1 hypothetical protein EONV-gp123 [Ectropis obliqua nucleopolyhedrovirus]
MAFVFVFILLISQCRNSIQSFNSSNDDIDELLNIIMAEMAKIQKTEVSDTGYTKMIFIILILLLIISLKTKIYKLLTCMKKKPQHSKDDDVMLDKITIGEFNYNINR